MNIEYMCKVIEDYIYHRKDKRVKINPQPNELPLVISAYNTAIQWFRINKIN